MKIVVDAYGGDYAPFEILKGAVDALNKEKGFSVVLIGKEKEIKEILRKFDFDASRVEIINAEEVITNDDSPTEALRQKKDSSLVKCFDILNADEEAAGMVSAGSTGAVLTGAVLLLKRIKGINRPGLCPLLPAVNGENKSVALIDCGANSDPKALNLVQFAIMGSAFMKTVHNVENPRVALLSNGTEDTKGNALSKEAFALLKESGVNFAGNIEGRDLIGGDYDVVVSDGFSGNVALKSCEGTAIGIFELIKKGIMQGGLRAKLGYLLLKPIFKSIKKKMDYNENGGAVLLGLKKNVIKSHGSSKAKSICASILQAKQMAESGVVEKIEEAIIERV
ncbi:MAG: phosphate acyltransferase PlsX [Christensenellales bacterium]|jgi:glycerol-3-phosphate acyltransferase PlsX